MLRWSLPEATTTTTVKFDVYSVVTGSVTPASCCCFSSSPNWIGRRKVPAPPNWFSLLSLTVFWSLSTSGTLALGPVTYDILLFPWCSSSQNPRHTHTHAGTYTRAHAHTQGTMPCCGCCWRPWPGGKFFATVPTRKGKNGKQILLMHSGNVRITPAGGHFNESG